MHTITARQAPARTLSYDPAIWAEVMYAPKSKPHTIALPNGRHFLAGTPNRLETTAMRFRKITIDEVTQLLDAGRAGGAEEIAFDHFPAANDTIFAVYAHNHPTPEAMLGVCTPTARDLYPSTLTRRGPSDNCIWPAA